MPTPCSAIAAAPGMGAYNVTKAAVIALSETLAAEAARDGVGVTVLLPGFYALPHGEIRWLWRAKRAAARTFARLVGALERRGVFSPA